MNNNEILKYGTPVIQLGASWATKRAVTLGYRGIVGEPAPAADDPRAPLAKVLAFTITTAVISTTVMVLVNRALARATATDPDFGELA